MTAYPGHTFYAICVCCRKTFSLWFTEFPGMATWALRALISLWQRQCLSFRWCSLVYSLGTENTHNNFHRQEQTRRTGRELKRGIIHHQVSKWTCKERWSCTKKRQQEMECLDSTMTTQATVKECLSFPLLFEDELTNYRSNESESWEQEKTLLCSRRCHHAR